MIIILLRHTRSPRLDTYSQWTLLVYSPTVANSRGSDPRRTTQGSALAVAMMVYIELGRVKKRNTVLQKFSRRATDNFLGLVRTLGGRKGLRQTTLVTGSKLSATCGALISRLCGPLDLVFAAFFNGLFYDLSSFFFSFLSVSFPWSRMVILTWHPSLHTSLSSCLCLSTYD